MKNRLNDAKSNTVLQLLRISLGTMAGLALALTLLAATGEVAQAQTENVLYSFKGGAGGQIPFAGVVRDHDGNLYGIADQGGANGLGTIFEITAAGKEKVLHTFTGGKDGSAYYSGLTIDKKGNLYGTTPGGGTHQVGSVFELTPKHKVALLYSFKDKKDGSSPGAGVFRDKTGDLFGTTFAGGAKDNGVVFRVTGGSETVLHAFTGTEEGSEPYGTVVVDAKKNIYGSTYLGGAFGFGEVFKVSSKGKFKILYSFTGGSDGSGPIAGVVRDKMGNLYGTTTGGGAHGLGAVFKVTPSGQETVLHSFAGTDGGLPYAGVILDEEGNLYGTTYIGGTGYGTVFELASDGTLKVLHNFANGTDGASPYAGLIMDDQGNLYGTTQYGGDVSCNPPYGCGTVFEVTP